jgi:hypothetical protein
MIIIIWLIFIIIPIIQSYYEEEHWVWIIWIIVLIILIIPIFTGLPVKNCEGTYKGYITAVEENGAIFKGYNVYIKSELSSSNEEKACINRDDKKLIEKLKTKMENKENVSLKYEGKLLYTIGECPGSTWMIVDINN